MVQNGKDELQLQATALSFQISLPCVPAIMCTNLGACRGNSGLQALKQNTQQDFARQLPSFLHVFLQTGVAQPPAVLAALSDEHANYLTAMRVAQQDHVKPTKLPPLVAEHAHS